MELDITNQIPARFIEEETRCDFLITAKMKEVWAIEIDLLEELKKVCEKYQLTYFADSGTLIGAVRHQGFIPWDDDIDIVMKRQDYNKLVKIAPTEFKQPYFLQNAHSEMFPRGYARLRNSNTTAFTKNDVGKDFNHGIFIDIFPLDNVPDDIRERNKWLKKINLTYRTLKVGSLKNRFEYKGLMQRIKYLIYRVVFKTMGYDNLIDKFEALCGKYNCFATEYVSYVAYSRGKPKHIWKSNCFDSSHEVPFEFTSINIPDGYDSRLTVEYKDYMRIVRANSSHGSTVFDPHTPFVIFMQEHTNQEILRLIQEEK